MTLIEERLRYLYPDKYKDMIFNEETMNWEKKPKEEEPLPVEEPPIEEPIIIEKPKKKRKHRKSIDHDIRLSVLNRDNNRCIKCGSDEHLQVHHKVYKSKGGSDDEENLITLCEACHAEEHKGEPVYNIMIKHLNSYS